MKIKRRGVTGKKNGAKKRKKEKGTGEKKGYDSMKEVRGV